MPTILPARIGEHVSSGYQTDDHAFTGGYTATTPSRACRGVRYAEGGTAPNLPEEGLVRLRECLQRHLSRTIPVVIVVIMEIIPTDHIRPQRHGDV